MTNLNKMKNWLIPSFDHDDGEPVNKRKRSLQHTSSQSWENDTTQNDKPYEFTQKLSLTSNLSTLLTACEPKNSSDLVTSKQKQKEIVNWLQTRGSTGQPCAVVVSGPSGCGKTTAIKVLAKEYGFDILEWITPVDHVIDENNRRMRQSERFEDFLIRAVRYNSIFSNTSQRLLLVKEFPNVYVENHNSFHNLLKIYFEYGKKPIIFTCTEMNNSNMMNTLFPVSVRDQYGIDVINLLPATQTAMKNMMKRVSPILNSKAANMLYVGQHTIDEVLSNSVGDVRSALLNTIFKALKVPENELKSECGNREESLGLLHGIGRVINPKREKSGNGWKFVHNPEDIAESFQSQASVFINFLQENYLNTMGTIEEASSSANYLCLGDTMNAVQWRVSILQLLNQMHCMNPKNRSLTEITLSICIRGIMVMNQKPITKWNPVRKPQSDKAHEERSLCAAEIRWYQSIIKPRLENKLHLLNVDDEPIED